MSRYACRSAFLPRDLPKAPFPFEVLSVPHLEGLLCWDCSYKIRILCEGIHQLATPRPAPRSVANEIASEVTRVFRSDCARFRPVLLTRSAKRPLGGVQHGDDPERTLITKRFCLAPEFVRKWRMALKWAPQPQRRPSDSLSEPSMHLTSRETLQFVRLCICHDTRPNLDSVEPRACCRSQAHTAACLPIVVARRNSEPFAICTRCVHPRSTLRPFGGLLSHCSRS